MIWWFFTLLFWSGFVFQQTPKGKADVFFVLRNVYKMRGGQTVMINLTFQSVCSGSFVPPPPYTHCLLYQTTFCKRIWRLFSIHKARKKWNSNTLNKRYNSCPDGVRCLLVCRPCDVEGSFLYTVIEINFDTVVELECKVEYERLRKMFDVRCQEIHISDRTDISFKV